MQSPPSLQKVPHVVIVGAGFGGLAVARRLDGKPVNVTLLDRRSYHLFTPLLYQVGTAALSPGEVAIPVRTLFRRSRNVRTLMAEMQGVQLDARRLQLTSREWVCFDYLVVATGARPHFFGKRDQWAPHVHTLESLESALTLRERILYCFEREERRRVRRLPARAIRFAILGAGPSGVELAGALAEFGRRVAARDYRTIARRDIEVVLFEAAERVLPPFNERSSADAKRQLQELGVTVRLSEKVEAVHRGRVVTSRGEYRADVLCWGSGVKPVSPASALGNGSAEKGIAVARDCSLEGYPNTFAIGDVSRFTTEQQEALPGLAPVAMQQGRSVADSILADVAGRQRRPFRYEDRGLMAVIGRKRAVVQTRRLQLSGPPAWLAWVALHVWYLVGFRSRVFVLLEWLWSYVGARPGAQLISRDASTAQIARDLQVSAAEARSAGAKTAEAKTALHHV
jgi:NADH dehydrogenase